MRFNQKRAVKQKYYISGRVETTSKYSRTRSGTIKHYDKRYHDSHEFKQVIEATSRREAEAIYKKMAMDEFSINVDNSGSSGSGGNNDDPFIDDVDDVGYYDQGGGSGGGGGVPTSDDYKEQTVDDIFIDDVQPASSYTASSEANSMMRRAYPVNYDFIPADDKYVKKRRMRDRSN